MSNTDTNRDYASEVVSRLSQDYAELMNSVSTVLAKLRALPKEITTEDDLEAYSQVIRDGRDLRKRLDAYHDAEKQPYLRSGQGVDQFFFGLEEKLARRKPRDPAGGLDVADARVDDYMQKKLAAARAERERIAREEAAKADAIREQELAARRASEEAAARAARARNEQNIALHKAEAERQRKAMEDARAAEILAQQKADDALIDTKASAADMTRARLDTGAIATMAQVPFVEITDVTLLDKDAIWPHLSEAHILQALKSWAKVTGHKKPMAGATIEMRNKGRVT